MGGAGRNRNGFAGPANLPLVARVSIASGQVAAAVALALLVLVVANASLRRASDAAVGAQDVSTATLTLERLVDNLESGLRGYALTGNERLLRPVGEGRRALPAALARVSD